MALCCVSGLCGEGAVLQGTPAPCAPLGRVVPGTAEAQALGLPRKGQAAPVCGGAKILGTFSAFWVQVVALQGSGGFWGPPVHLACSGSPELC